MYKMIKFEFSRMIHSRSFILSFLIATIFSSISAFEKLFQFIQGIDHISAFYRWIGHINLSFGSHYLYMIIPFILPLSHSISLFSDSKSKYIDHIITRNSRKAYFKAKYIVSFVGGGFIFSAAVALNLVLLLMFMPAEIPDPINMTSDIDQFRFCSFLYYTKPFLFSFLWCCVCFLWGGTISILGLLTGMFSQNMITNMSIPFFIFISEGVIGSYLMQKNIFTINGRLLELIWTDMLYSGTPAAAPTDYIIMTILIMLAVSTAAYCIKVKKYDSI